jgi:hypothetical protein
MLMDALLRWRSVTSTRGQSLKGSNTISMETTPLHS